MNLIIAKFNYVLYIVLMMMGLWAMIAKSNLIKKVVGLGIFQTAIILFYISISVKKGANIPIIHHHVDPNHAADAAHMVIDAAKYANPLPHVLMLTAIVVGVATLGLALTIIQHIYQEHHTIEEDEILEQLNQ
ncbi:MAG: cation:proton antiporter subunit C [bacterium]|nr:cation:proton antiporter subunit C [bacterium]